MKYLIILFFFVFQNSYSQTPTQRFFYEFKDKNSSKLYVLDINEESIKFYKNDFLISDSLYNVYKTDTNIQNVSYDTDLAVIKNSSENEFIELKSFDLIDYYLVKEEAIKQDWKLEKERKNENGFSLQKATLKYKGRDWTAWYCSDIPLPYGPYKFGGLPGLIFELYDAENMFHFSLTKLQKLNSVYDTSNFLENDFGFKRRIISDKVYNKMLKEYYMNPLNYSQKTEGNTEVDYQQTKNSNDETRRRLEKLDKENIEIQNILGKK